MPRPKWGVQRGLFFLGLCAAYFLILSWAEPRTSRVCFLQKYCLSVWRCFCISWLRVEETIINVFMTLPMRPLGWKMKSVSLMGFIGRRILQLIVVLLLIQLIPIYIIRTAGLVYTLRNGLGTFIFRRESHSCETQQPQGQTCFLVNDLKAERVCPVFFPVISAGHDSLSCACTT